MPTHWGHSINNNAWCAFSRSWLLTSKKKLGLLDISSRRNEGEWYSSGAHKVNLALTAQSEITHLYLGLLQWSLWQANMTPLSWVIRVCVTFLLGFSRFNLGKSTQRHPPPVGTLAHAYLPSLRKFYFLWVILGGVDRNLSWIIGVVLMEEEQGEDRKFLQWNCMDICPLATNLSTHSLHQPSDRQWCYKNEYYRLWFMEDNQWFTFLHLLSFTMSNWKAFCPFWMTEPS